MKAQQIIRVYTVDILIRTRIFGQRLRALFLGNWLGAQTIIGHLVYEPKIFTIVCVLISLWGDKIMSKSWGHGFDTHADTDGRYTYCNKRDSGLIGEPLHKLKARVHALKSN